MLLVRQVVVERERLKMAIIPSLDGDYFSQRIHNTQLVKEIEYSELPPNSLAVLGQTTVKQVYGVSLLGQNPDYPNGCESASAVMLLNYMGIDISLKEFIDRYLPKKEVFEKDGVRYGPNPSRYYAGDPADPYRGWGCFSPVIAAAIQSLLREGDYTSLAVQTGGYQSLSELVYELPAVIWVTSDYSPASDIYEWQSREDGKTYTYPRGSHTVLLVGCDEMHYLIHDPLKPEEPVRVERERLEASYDSMGRQSVLVYDYGYAMENDT